jgi:hypothetical protein
MEQKRVLPAKQIASDIRAGLGDEQLMRKYSLTTKKLQTVLDRLLEEGFITEDERGSGDVPPRKDRILEAEKGLLAVTDASVVENPPNTGYDRELGENSQIKNDIQNNYKKSHRTLLPLTDENLTKERNFFLVSYISLVVTLVIYGLVILFVFSSSPQFEDMRAGGLLAALLAKIYSVYLVARLSRFLREPLWLTVIYCILAPFSGLFWIPTIGLLLKVRKTRKLISSENRN